MITLTNLYRSVRKLEIYWKLEITNNERAKLTKIYTLSSYKICGTKTHSQLCSHWRVLLTIHCGQEQSKHLTVFSIMLDCTFMLKALFLLGYHTVWFKMQFVQQSDSHIDGLGETVKTNWDEQIIWVFFIKFLQIIITKLQRVLSVFLGTAKNFHKRWQPPLTLSYANFLAKVGQNGEHFRRTNCVYENNETVIAV